MSPIHKGHKAMPKGKHNMMPNKEMGKHMVEKKAKPNTKGGGAYKRVKAKAKKR